MTSTSEDAVTELAVRGTGLLRDFNQRGVLEVADVNVAVSLARLGGESTPEVLLALALTVRALRQGSVCLDVPQVAHEAYDSRERLVEESSLAWPEPGRWIELLRASPLVHVQPETAGPESGWSASGWSAAAPAAGERPRPLRLLGHRLYLDRYFADEESVRTQLLGRRRATPPAVDPAEVRALLDRLFDRAGLAEDEPNWQRIAAANSVLNWVNVVAGGPGTGKTTTVAKVLAGLQALHRGRLRITLAAPTGKAAARLAEAVRAEASRLPDDLGEPLLRLEASTLHRVLGWRPDSQTRFRHDRFNPLPWDVVVVDEMSMVALPMMARLLEATPPGTRVLLVGDPDQLTSVEAGAVMADVTHAESNSATLATDDPRREVLHRVGADDRADTSAPAREPALTGPVVRGVTELRHTWRFGAEIGALARAVREGDAERCVALLRAGGAHLGWVETDLAATEPATLTDGGDAPLAALRELVQRSGAELVTAAGAGDAERAIVAMERHRVLCAHRSGPFGVRRWDHHVEQWLQQRIPGYGQDGEWYLGRPLLVTANDADVDLYNGDTGVVVTTPSGPQAAFARGSHPVLHPLIHLDAVQSVHAMTVHKAQGSQFREVTFVLPPPESALLTRELVYTAVTRARDRVEIIGTEEALRRAVARPAQRASGLRRRL